MSVIYLLISMGIVIAIGFFFAFSSSCKDGKYDDDYTLSGQNAF